MISQKPQRVSRAAAEKTVQHDGGSTDRSHGGFVDEIKQRSGHMLSIRHASLAVPFAAVRPLGAGF